MKNIIETKVVALDVYGTMLASNDADNELPPRLGLEEFLERCKNLGLILCTCSDGNTTNVKYDLKESGISLDYFDQFFQLGELGSEKDFGVILKYYNLSPKQLLVIGDREDREIIPAINLGCHYALVKEYSDRGGSNIDINEIKIF